MPGSDPDRIGVFEGDHLSVAAASPRYLLAMKLLASRSRDRTLTGLLGSKQEVEDGEQAPMEVALSLVRAPGDQAATGARRAARARRAQPGPRKT
jgi:hypothetical protein